ncbi:hypothetical protein A2U01_0057036, partial [Trifolium medium]|nr:hypothetical protein [Trifolium medium]
TEMEGKVLPKTFRGGDRGSSLHHREFLDPDCSGLGHELAQVPFCSA